MAFLAQKLIYTINIWFNFVFGSFFEQDYPLKLFILNAQEFNYKNWCSLKFDQWFFSNFWLSEDLSIRSILSEKKYGGTGLISEKTAALYAELNKRVKAATSSYSVTGNFLQYIYSVPVTKNPQNIRSRCLVNEFCLTDIF